MKTKISLFVAICLLALSFSTYAAAAGKIGVVDVRVVQSKSRWGEMIKQELKRQKDKLQADFEQKTKTFKEKAEEFEKKKAVLDEKSKTRQAQELTTMRQEGEKLAMESQSQMSRMQEQLIPPMNEKILEIARQIGKKDSYDLVLDKSAVLFSSDKDDLTSKVISELDRATPASLPASGGKN
jgi:outer membrane protein